MESNTNITMTGTPDRARLMEIFGQLLQENPSYVEERMKQFADNLDGRRPNSTREERISAFRKARQSFLGHQSARDMHTLSVSQGWDVKPKAGRSKRGTLAPIRVRDLQVGVTHRGRMLHGSIIEEPLFTGSSICFLLEDHFGDLVHVGVYNTPGNSWRAAEKSFPKGREIGIEEPYFKTFADMSMGIRVDEPAEIADCPPATVGEWMKRGKSSDNPKAAIQMYHKAWEALQKDREELAVLLTNRAICLSNAGGHLEGLRCAAVAAHLNPGHEKAVHWREQALARVQAASDDAGRMPNNSRGSKDAGKSSKAPGKAQRQKDGAAAAADGSSSWLRIPGVVVWAEAEEVCRPAGGRKSEADSSWQSLKDAGKDHFKEDRWEEADAKYAAAAMCHEGRGGVAETLSFIAEASLDCRQHSRALLHSTVGALLRPKDDAVACKLWVARAKALEGMGDAEASVALDGVPLKGVKEEAAKLSRRLSAKQGVQPIAEKSTKQQYQQGEGLMRNLLGESKDKAPASMVEMMAAMHAMAPGHTKAKMEKEFGPLMKREVPTFHTDYAKERGLPTNEAGDRELCQRILYDGYANARVSPWCLEHGLRKGTYEPRPEEMVKRFHGPGGLKWFLDHLPLATGAIVESKEEMKQEAFRYMETLRHSFGNQAPKHELLHKGTVHVAIGFNDLGQLLVCDLLDAPQGKRGPLRFVGFEASAYSVAKSLVIAAMLASNKVPINHCLQAWFSSGWTRACANSFRACAENVLKDGNASSKVTSYLSHWVAAPDVTLSQARHLWLKSHEAKTHTDPANLQRRRDRMALCHYILTGDLLSASTGSKKSKGKAAAPDAEVGSLAMWSVPPNTPPIADVESVLDTVQLTDLLEGPEDLDFCQRLGRIIGQRLQRLRQWLVDGDLELEMHCEYVALCSAVAARIRALRPWTMSWSNCLDYVPASMFHRLARECSEEGSTIHFGYSMNWPAEVVGTSIMDYPDASARSALIDRASEQAEVSLELLPRFKDLLVHPHHDNPLNTTGYALAVALYEKWAAFFFSKRIAGAVQVGETNVMVPYNPFARTSSTLYMTWTYDMSISFGPRADDATAKPECPVS